MNIWKMDGINNTGDVVQKCWRLLKVGRTCTAGAEFQGFKIFLEGLSTDLAMPVKNKLIFSQASTKFFPAAQNVLVSHQIQKIYDDLSS